MVMGLRSVVTMIADLINLAFLIDSIRFVVPITLVKTVSLGSL